MVAEHYGWSGWQSGWLCARHSRPLSFTPHDPNLFHQLLARQAEAGATLEQLALLFGLPACWVKEHLEAHRFAPLGNRLSLDV